MSGTDVGGSARPGEGGKMARRHATRYFRLPSYAMSGIDIGHAATRGMDVTKKGKDVTQERRGTFPRGL
eukprot:846239-Rhodomonas_salina.1